MTRSVTITTPIPTLEEFADDLGLTKARQRSLAPIFIERRPQGDYAVRRGNSQKASRVYPTQREAVEKARDLNPSGTILVERVRGRSVGARDQFRKP
jgi:hypothetical protein